MIVYKVEEAGRCQAVPCPSHAHVAQLLRQGAVLLDRILYHPPAGATPRYRVYLSLNSSHCLVIPLTGAMPSTTEIVQLYTWSLLNRHEHSYRYITVAQVVPTPNQSRRTNQSIAEWCDTQIDAFTWCLVTMAGHHHQKANS